MSLGRRKNTHRWNDKVTNELFLWKKLVRNDRVIGPSEIVQSKEEAYFWLSKGFGSFSGLLEKWDRPSILDLGPVTNKNISYYGELGWKVHAHDLLLEYQEACLQPLEEVDDDEDPPPNPIEGILAELKFEPGSLHGVLCWDVLDRLPLIWTRELIRRISESLDEGGVILAIFGAKSNDENGQTHRGFRIQGDKYLEPIMDDDVCLERYDYGNGEIMSLFSSFKVLNFYMMKNNFREILVQKQPQASLKISA